MVERIRQGAAIATFNCGGGVVVVDGEFNLAYGRNVGGFFLLPFSELRRLLDGGRSKMTAVEIKDKCLVVRRIMDFYKSELVSVDLIKDSSNSDKIYEHVFDFTTSGFIIGCLKGLSD